MNFNKVIIAGNLTRDPELTYTRGGTAIANFALAVNRKWKDESGESKEEVSFIDCAAFKGTAESVAQYKKKGDCILVEGRLRQETWDDKTTGAKRSKLKVMVENIQFGADRQSRSDDAPEAQPDAPPPARKPNQVAGKPVTRTQPEPPDDSGDQEIPF